MCGCVGGGWVRMVMAGEVSKDEAAVGGGGIVFFFLRCAMCLWALRSGGSVYRSSFLGS